MGFFSSIGKALSSKAFSNVVSTGASLLSGYGSYRAGRDAEDAYKYNEKVAKREAAYQKQRTKYLLEQHKTETAKLKGYQRTGFAKAGVKGGQGTPLEVLQDTDRLAAIDANIIRYGGEIRADSALKEAKMYRKAGRSEMRAGWLNAAGSILTAPARWSF